MDINRKVGNAIAWLIVLGLMFVAAVAHGA